MSRASKIRTTKIKSASTPPNIKNRNKTSKPSGVETEKNAIADNIKSAIVSYGFIEDMAEFKQEEIVASAVGNYGKDSHLLQQEVESGYESVVGVDKTLDYDKPGLERVSKGVVVEQNKESGKVKRTEDKKYYKD